MAKAITIYRLSHIQGRDLLNNNKKELLNIIVEFLTKTEYLTYNNYFKVCVFCGMGNNEISSIEGRLKAHHPNCLYYHLIVSCAKVWSNLAKGRDL